MSIDLTALFSKTARAVRPSAIREMAKHAAEPGAISFARGDPAPEIFPVEEFYEGTKVLLERGREILQYGNTAGYAPLADFLCGWLTPRMGRTITREQLLITSGSGQVCDLLVRATVDRGDFVIVEEPTFLGNTNSMRVAGANFITVPVDEHGMVLDGLPEKIEAVQRAGGKISFIYTIPTFHNPAGVTMSLERRRQLVAIAQKHGILIMEDDPYRFVRFEGDDLPSLYELDGGSGVISAGSFSKILAPGTRVGWCVGPEAIVRIMTTLKQSVDSSASVVSQALVAEYCRSGRLGSRSRLHLLERPAAVWAKVYALRYLATTMRAEPVGQMLFNHSHWHTLGNGARRHHISGIKHSQALRTHHSTSMQCHLLGRNLHCLATLRTLKFHRLFYKVGAKIMKFKNNTKI